MSRKVFVSHEYTEREFVGSLKSWFQADGGTCQGELVVFFDPNARTDVEIDNAIVNKMRECQIVLFLNSENAHNKRWIDREAEVATSLNMPMVVMPIKDGSYGRPGRLKGRNNVHEVEVWGSTELCRVLNRIVL
jgi:hypothetical protein